MKTPKHFARIMPWDSVKQSSEAETVAQNIMVILGRLGNVWRKLSWREYKKERKKDGGFPENERGYFDEVIDFTVSEETARLFSSSWKKN